MASQTKSKIKNKNEWQSKTRCIEVHNNLSTTLHDSLQTWTLDAQFIRPSSTTWSVKDPRGMEFLFTSITIYAALDNANPRGETGAVFDGEKAPTALVGRAALIGNVGDSTGNII